MPLVSIPGPAEFIAEEVQFAMREPSDPDQHRHLVTITLGALDGLFAADLSKTETVQKVEAYRAEFEQIASAKHDEGQPLRITINDWIARFPLPA